MENMREELCRVLTFFLSPAFFILINLSIILRYNGFTFPVFSFSHILGPEAVGCWVPLSPQGQPLPPSHFLKACGWGYSSVHGILTGHATQHEIRGGVVHLQSQQTEAGGSET